MPSAQQLRAQIENQLANRIPSALTPAPRLVRETIPTGLHSVDAMLGGGLPLGAITEVIGDPSSGRTTFAMSVLANVNRSEHVCAWIDASDEFDPVSAATIGITLPQLLLVRCGVPAKYSASQKKAADKLPAHEPLETAATKPAGGGGSPHPRNEVRGLGKAVGELFQHKLSERNAKPGTPSANNIRLGKVTRNEQVASDRLPPRRAENLTMQYPITRTGFEYLRRPTSHKPTFKLEQETIEQAIKVTDLLLHNGGFRAIVLDLASFSSCACQQDPIGNMVSFQGSGRFYPCVSIASYAASLCKEQCGAIAAAYL